MNADELKAMQAKLAQRSGRSEAEIEAMVRQKQADLKGLIKTDAALVIVAKELGVEIAELVDFRPPPAETTIRHEQGDEQEHAPKTVLPITPIKDIKPGMKNLFCEGRVAHIVPAKDFTRKNDHTPGKVASFFLRDKSGEIRFPLWDDDAQLIEDKVIGIGDTIRAINVRSVDGLDGKVELTRGYQGKIELNPPDVHLPPVTALIPTAPETKYVRKTIADIHPGEKVTLQGKVAKPIDRLFFYEACEKCKKKAGTCRCVSAGPSITRPVLNVTFEDGTGTIRLAFFGEVVDPFLGEASAEIGKLPDQAALEAKVAELSRKIMGKEFIVQGRAKENTYFARSNQGPQVEIMVDDSHGVEPAAAVAVQAIPQPTIPKAPTSTTASSPPITETGTVTPVEVPPIVKAQPIPPTSPTPAYQPLQIFTTSDGRLTRPIPYWAVKLLIHHKRLAKPSGYKILGNAPLPFEQIVENATPIDAERTAMINLAAEEARVERILQELNNTQKTMEDYLWLRQALMQFKARLDLDKGDELEVIDEIEEIEQTLQQEGFEWFVGALVTGSKTLAADGILVTKSKDMKAPPQFFAPVVEDGKDTEGRAKQFNQKWEGACQKLHQYAEPVLDRAAEFPGPKEEPGKPGDKLFNGEKFHFLSFDINNLHISAAKKHPQQAIDVISIIKDTILPKDGRYLAYYFATKQLAHYQKKQPDDEQNRWFIESTIKGRNEQGQLRYVDVDGTLMALTYNVLAVYGDQIERFTLGSGDKDLHLVCEHARARGIPVEIVVAEEPNLSNELRNLSVEWKELY